MKIKNFSHIFKFDLFYWILFLTVPAGILGFMLANPGNRFNSDKNQVNPMLRTRSYNIPLGGFDFCNQVEKLIPKISSYGMKWKMVYSDCNPSADNPFIIKAEVPVFFFTDDLEIRMYLNATKDKIQVDIMSESRIGKYDFGENKRHVYTLFRNLDNHFYK